MFFIQYPGTVQNFVYFTEHLHSGESGSMNDSFMSEFKWKLQYFIVKT